MAKPWLGKVGALFHYMHSLPMDMKRGCIGILIHPHLKRVQVKEKRWALIMLNRTALTVFLVRVVFVLFETHRFC